MAMKIRNICLLVYTLAAPACLVRADVPAYLNDRLDIETRVEDALGRLTVAEKIAMIHAQSKFTSPGVPRLGIPDLTVNDGPQGVRDELLWDSWENAGHTNDSCTSYPALTSLAATWNRGLARRQGRSLGEEFLQRGKDVALPRALISPATLSVAVTSNIWAKTHFWPVSWPLNS